MKYNSRRTDVDGKTFDSKKEAIRYTELQYMQRAGLISDLRTQVPYQLIPSQKDERGRVAERAVTYKADFVYTQDGQTIVEDVKSAATKTPEYIIKRKLMLWLYKIRVREV